MPLGWWILWITLIYSIDSLGALRVVDLEDPQVILCRSGDRF